MKTDHVFSASDGEKLAVSTYGDNTGPNTRCVIYIHGFKGFKDWGFVPYIGEYLASKGFYTLTFNFSHNGIGDNPTEFTELDKFAENTFSREVRELSELIDAVRDGIFGEVENPRIGLLGHSRGGGITILTTPIKPDISAAAVWSSVSTFSRYTDDQKQKWRQDGSIDVINARTGQVMKLNVGLLDDFEQFQEGMLNIEMAVKNLHCPLLVVHGENDEAVPVAEGKLLHQWSGGSSDRLLTVPGTGHTFDAKHPFEGSNDKLDQVLKKTADFFAEHI